MDTKTILSEASDRMQKTIEHLEEELLNIRAGKASPTEERRKELVKQVRQEAETARISLRNARRDAVEAFKKAQKEGMSEDEAKDGETQAQKLLDKFTKSLDAILDNKEKEIMTV